MQKEILRVFEYFYFFSYPINFKTIKKYLGVKVNDKKLKKEVERLVKLKKITFKRNLYTLGEYNKNKLEIRNSKFEISKKKLNNLRFRSYLKLISMFPQIQLVGLSGSAAMNNAKENDDIDLFIIASVNRIWTTRLICLIIATFFGVKRSRLEKNVSNKVCLNLFFDKKNIEIPNFKRNYYIAHEIIQLKPLINKNYMYEIFLYRNRWVCDIFPNVEVPTSSPQLVPRSSKDEVGKRGSSESRFPIRSGMTCVLDFIENFIKKIQLYLINKHKTKEIITDTQLWFFPDDFEEKLPEFARKKLN